MRLDSVGLFWQDLPTTRKGKKSYARPMPPIPDTNWIAPKEFPNLTAAKVLSLDCETYDPELDKHGPGWARNKGHIVGVSIGADNDGRWYFPIRHEVEPETNLDPDKVLRWLADVLRFPHQPKIGANLIYDLGWLREEGIEVYGELVDVQAAEALLSEHSEVALEVLAQKYLGEGKESALLQEWIMEYYAPPRKKWRRDIYRSPPRLVGPYAESDADLPLRLASLMYPLLVKEELLDLFRMECALIPLILAMRFAGVRVDIDKAEQLHETLKERIDDHKEKLRNQVGFDVDINSANSLAKVFNAMGLDYKKTKKGNPSFTRLFLENLKHPIGDTIREIRRCEKLRGTFIESYLLNSHVNGKIHCQFHLLRGDRYGTRSGRLSSSTPNLQNIPSRDDELAPLIRGLFIPDDGHGGWRRYDYSQIEYRYLIHFAVGPGADEVRAHFRAHPKTDYHEMAIDLVAPKAGWDVSTPELRKLNRKPIKNINFGLIFGMGVPKLAAMLGLSKKEAAALFAAYHEGVPFAKETLDSCAQIAQETGIITTILGRKSRFELWEPMNRAIEGIALPYEEASLVYGPVRRAYTHKALNRRLQGSAADLMKKAMLECYRSGVFDETGVPRVTVHDELGFSDSGEKAEAYAEVKHIMETAIPMAIPIKADCEIGPDWGHVYQVGE